MDYMSVIVCLIFSFVVGIFIAIVQILQALLRVEEYMDIIKPTAKMRASTRFDDVYADAFEGDPINPDKRINTVRSS